MTTPFDQGAAPILLAFSGGLDTSFLVPWLKETYGQPVITVTVDTGGLDTEARAALAARSAELGALEHHLIDARHAYFDQVLKYLIMGNVRRGGTYPLCVGAERVLQAQTIAQMAVSLKTPMVAHGCTAAGNDQVRFEVALRTLAPELTILAPVRDRAFKRPEQLQYLQDHRLPIPPFGAAYSVNRGLWGVTIGGQETLTSKGSIPESAWVLSKDAFSHPRAPARHVLGFAAGIPASLDGERLTPVALIEKLEQLAGPYGIGRGIHLGDTVIGTKGRVAFEAPAAEVLLTAHRELEKLVLTGKQARIKESVAQPYGDLVHEGQHLDPVCRDIEALLVSSQARVSGEVSVLLRPGAAFIEGLSSPHSLMAASKGVYGEAAGEWTPADALGHSKMLALTGIFYQRAGAAPLSGAAAGESTAPPRGAAPDDGAHKARPAPGDAARKVQP
jgi:argininosuccinate synthase